MMENDMISNIILLEIEKRLFPLATAETLSCVSIAVIIMYKSQN